MLLALGLVWCLTFCVSCFFIYMAWYCGERLGSAVAGVKEWEDPQPSGPPGTIHASINIRRFRVPLIRSRRPVTIIVCLQDAARLPGAAKLRWSVRHNRLGTCFCGLCCSDRVLCIGMSFWARLPQLAHVVGLHIGDIGETCC